MTSTRNSLISNVQKKIAKFEKLKCKAISTLFGTNKTKSTPCLAQNFLNESVTSSIEGSLRDRFYKEKGLMRQPFCSTPRNSCINKLFNDENGKSVSSKKESDISSDAGLGDEQGSSTLNDSTFDETLTEKLNKLQTQAKELDRIRANLSQRDILIK
jgi:hypothetical protein